MFILSERPNWGLEGCCEWQSDECIVDFFRFCIISSMKSINIFIVEKVQQHKYRVKVMASF